MQNLQLRVSGVLSVLLATFAGFGGAMCGTSIIYEFFKRRGSRHSWSNQPHGTSDIEQPQESTEPANVLQDEPNQQGSLIEAVQAQQPTEPGHAPQHELQISQTRQSGQ